MNETVAVTRTRDGLICLFVHITSTSTPYMYPIFARSNASSLYDYVLTRFVRS